MTESSPATVQSIIDTVLHTIPVQLPPDTVDTLKLGDPSLQVSGIAVCFLANLPVLRQAVQRGLNFVITHEPTFYNHLDKADWLAGDTVYEEKLAFCQRHQLAIWRFHDGSHRLRPDGILLGMAAKLGWEVNTQSDRQTLFEIPPCTVAELAGFLKERLGIKRVRVAGELDSICRRVGLRVGASGGRSQIELLSRGNADVVICGESPEWETCEYVRDANAQGAAKALIVLGHAMSEEGGIEWVAGWLRSLLPAGLRVEYIETGDPFVSV